MTSTSYPRDAGDWRGVFIRHLAHALVRQQNLQLDMWAPPGELPAGVNPATLPDESRWLERLMADGGVSHLLRQRRWKALLAPLQLLRMLGAAYRRNTAVDVYHINWLQCALPLPNSRIPALISVLGNDLHLLHIPLMRSLLRRVMRRRKVAICPNADWMRAPLEAAFGDVACVIPVAFGVDPDWYAIERQPSWESPIWLAVTRLTVEKLGPLFEWSEALFRDSKRQLHLFGPMQERIKIPDWIHYHGPVSSSQLSSEWFPRACGLITLSQHAEGRPQVLLEAMAAGLPILASRTPAHADLNLANGEAGALCDSPATYANALRALEDAATNLSVGAAAQRWAKEQIGTWNDCASRYVHVYQKLIAKEDARD